TARSPQGAPAPSCWNPPNRAASGHAGRSSAPAPSGCSRRSATRRATAPSGSTTGWMPSAPSGARLPRRRSPPSMRSTPAGRSCNYGQESSVRVVYCARRSLFGAGTLGVLTKEREETGDGAVWIDYGLDDERAFGGTSPTAPRAAVDALYARWRTPQRAGHPPLTGGLVGFIGWEAVRQLERLPAVPPAEVPIPGQALAFVSELVALDHRTGTATLIAAVLGDGAESPDPAWERAQGRLDALQRDLAR